MSKRPEWNEEGFTAWLEGRLRELGPRLAYPAWQDKWTPERPVTGYGYVLSEVLWHYTSLSNTSSRRIRFEDGTSHWYLQAADGTVINFTESQFDEAPDYSKSEAVGFYPGEVDAPRGLISARGHELAVFLGYAG